MLIVNPSNIDTHSMVYHPRQDPTAGTSHGPHASRCEPLEGERGDTSMHDNGTARPPAGGTPHMPCIHPTCHKELKVEKLEGGRDRALVGPV